MFHKYNISQVNGSKAIRYWNRNCSLLIYLIISLHNSTLYLKVTHPNCWFEPNYDYFIWNNHGAKKLAFLSEVSFTLIKFAPSKLPKRKLYLALQIHCFPLSLDSPNFFFIILLSSHKFSPPNILFQNLTQFLIN